eukprot:3883227-Ditylum_brightwellii.AAC.1
MAAFNDQDGKLTKEDFAHYTRQQIYTVMPCSLAQASWPIQLLRKAHETLKAACALQESLHLSLSRANCSRNSYQASTRHYTRETPDLHAH